MSKSPYKTERSQSLRALNNKPSFASTLDIVEKFGWEAMLIHSDQQSTSFAYTVGLADTMNLPELIVVGLNLEVAHAALGYAIDAMKAGNDLTNGRYRDIIGDVEVLFQPVSQRWFKHIMCRADWYYGYSETHIPTLQMIYPDLENRFQWDQGFNEYFRQPLLSPDIEQSGTEDDFWATNDPESSLFDWKFPDPPHTRVFLSQTVHEKEEAITYVSHDTEDGAWQFLGDKMDDGGGPVISCFHHPIDNDPTLKELHDLPLGWYAVRDKPGDPWQRFEKEPEEQDSED